MKCAGLTSLDLSDNVTFIGREAFYSCTGLTSLTIPASVTEMYYAFFGCSGLTDITISDGVTSIYGAFNRCTGLTSITIPDSVTSISDAFYGCTGLESIVVPDSVTEMDYAFTECTGLRSVNIPSSVTSIKGAFSGCTSLTSIEIPDSVTTIGDYAFSSCTGLTSIVIPDSVTTISDQAFYGCTGLESVAIPNSVTEIGAYAFEGCTQVSTVIISCTPNSAVYNFIYENFRRAERIYVHAYENGACTDCGVACTHEGGTLGTPVPTEDGTQHVATYTCCGTAVTEDHTPDENGYRLDDDGTHSYTCSGCGTAIRGSHTFEGGACTTCGVTGGYCGSSTNDGGEQSVVWTLKDNHLVISGTGAMADYSYYSDLPWRDAYQTLTDVTIGEGVTRIGKHAFYNFRSLTEITIPASVESIGYEAFRSSTVSSVTFAPNSRLTTIDDYAFSYVDSLKQITLPASVETIGNSAFESCYALETVTIAEGSRLSSLGYMAFFNCTSLTAISIPESATACKTIDGVLYSGDGTTLLLYPAGKTDEAFTTPAGVTTIAETAMNYAQFRTVTLSEGVTTIGNGAFLGCYGMQSVSLPSTLTSIGNSTFFHCSGLTTVTIPGSVSSIGTEAFAGCYGLTEVTIPASMTSIGSNAFGSCYDLTTVNAPCTWDGSLYTFEDTVTVIVADHDSVNGMCADCGGFETPTVDPGEYEDETWDDVYLISNAGQLYWFANEVNNNHNNGIGARLTANITVPASVSKGGSFPDWTPIGQGYTPYCGPFDGQGYTISGLYCEANYAGLFGYTDYNYNIRNVGVVNGTFIGSSYAGALVGYASSDISGCWASGNTVSGNYAGGLVGQNTGFINSSRATSNTVKGELVGGLVGYNNNGSITRSYVTGNTATGDSAGGLVGENYGTIENCCATGNTPGYLVGYNGDPITNSFTDGSALFRDSYGDVTNSYYVAASATDDGGRTTAQFESGEIAYLLQSAIEPEEVYDEENGEWVMVDAPHVWGQSIGSASYPSLGGKRVYQVLSCDGEGTAYSNTDEQAGHSYASGVCTVCGDECPHDTGNGNVCGICGATVERSMMTLPVALTAIEAEAFTGTAAEAVVIPASCTSISSDVFTGCPNLHVVIFTSADCTIADGAIPTSVTIVAPAGGSVEAWAETNGCPFVSR